MKKTLVVFALILLASAALSGTLFAANPNCGVDPTHPSCKNGGDDPSGTQPEITAFNFGYNPSPVTTAGITVIVGVTEGKHTFTSFLEVGGEPIFDSGKLRGDQTFEITGLSAGTEYTYFCEIHGAAKMSGVFTTPP